MRHLHSFPTRRSSDLIGAKSLYLHNLEVLMTEDINKREDYFSLMRKNLKILDEATQRSEEHTSELQSRGHIVCRLLLEKKNHNYIRQKQALYKQSKSK